MQTITILSIVFIYVMSISLFVASFFLGIKIAKGLKQNKPNYNFINLDKLMSK